LWKKINIYTIYNNDINSNEKNKNNTRSNNKNNSTINTSLSKIPLWKEGEVYTRGVTVKTSNDSIYQLLSLNHEAKISPEKTSFLHHKVLNFSTNSNCNPLESPMLIEIKLILIVNAFLLNILSIYQQRRFGYIFAGFSILIYVEINSLSITGLHNFYLNLVNKMSGSVLFITSQKSK
jgi:hypothetical protein